jgi:hypothetical protein
MSDKVKLQIEDTGVIVISCNKVKVRQVVGTTGRTWPFYIILGITKFQFTSSNGSHLKIL